MAKPAAERGLLAGLPVPIKDLTEVGGRAHHPGLADLSGITSRRRPTSWSSISRPMAG